MVFRISRSTGMTVQLTDSPVLTLGKHIANTLYVMCTQKSVIGSK